jgi:hypothetical protein
MEQDDIVCASGAVGGAMPGGATKRVLAPSLWGFRIRPSILNWAFMRLARIR